MRNVIKEVITKKPKPFWEVILMVLTFVVGVNFLITLCNKLGEKYAGLASIAILILSIIICMFIIKRLLECYTYILVDDELLFEKNVGKKNNLILKVPIDDIKIIRPYRELENDENIAYTYKFICDREYDKFYFAEFEKEGKRYRFIFKPSDRLLKALGNKVLNNAESWGH
ncbi:hypothetical protein Y919_03885 [Caloranaerobacter azorensis H53214]|uniref:Uncharacterized protein n=1 Tax=Caloranaerobacter azorensis H53214 TaxID=1156417 RepID=A0A096BJE9_9FIRM|nr:hypothetical protein [Caloranaerobacter azorensis]KGG80893.1 hypothetical protein Y919_03885 [Caloranaerobacter azorensis H53214]